MKNTTRFLILIAVTLLISCQSKNKEARAERMVLADMSSLEDQGNVVHDRSKAASPPPPLKSTVKFTAPIITDEPIEEGEELQSQQVASNQAVVEKKKIIKDGSISIKTKDIEACKKRVVTQVKMLGGYVDTENLDNNNEQISYYLRVRIPATRFEAMLSGLEKGNDEVKSKNIQARDVTEEYVDIESRLATKQIYLKRYKELLTKASTVRDILAIEEQIRVIQEEIDSRLGRLKYIDDQVAFSTLDINLYMSKEYVYKPKTQDNFWERLKDAFSSGWRSVVGFLLMLFTLWPFILLIVGIVYAVKLRRKHVKNSK